ncbi:L-aspartate oxidase [Jeotgalibacillus sp. S-D1]|uniref:L-aspartate oxidase n=1 Tax=Jeotgalibacillus sp. S-D1 TaxID=2552189 RepID=UPI0014051701|nr:L-aspartate oxidase [Jeotgalibacillus sp. S-D1]
MRYYDVIIAGSGLAAYAVARRLSADLKVAIISNKSLDISNSMLAQGGVAAVFSEEDHWKYHDKDTLLAGDGHCDQAAVSYLTQQGPGVVNALISEGMKFDCGTSSGYALGMEGAHSRRRILHAGGDATGKKLTSFLHKNIGENIDQIEFHSVVDLLVENDRCIGINVSGKEGDISSIFGSHVVLATGGCGNLYQCTSNADTANGEGLSLAYYAGAKLADLEFVQFHPTVMASRNHPGRLVSEAVRGEGAVLVTDTGERIMKNIHPLEDLAPRDIVAREVFRRILRGEKIYLSIKYVKEFTKKFPTISAICRGEGVNLSDGLIPVKPGAHFHMGGIMVNGVGQTSLPGLYAVGEAACSGVHGANRLASNSLLEGLVYGRALADFLNEQPITRPIRAFKQSQSAGKRLVRSITIEEIRKLMLTHAGIERSSEKLNMLQRKLKEQIAEVDYRNLIAYTPVDLTFIHQATAAYLIAKSAFERKESRGAHYCTDFPEKKEEWAGMRIIQQINQNSLNGGLGSNEYDKSQKAAGAVFT